MFRGLYPWNRWFAGDVCNRFYLLVRGGMWTTTGLNYMEEIIKELGEKGDLYIGDNSENPVNKSRVEGLVKQYPFLESYKDYVGFLYKYSGFTFNDSEGSLSFYGLEGELTLDIETGEGEIIDDDGFFIIGDFTFYDRNLEEYSSVGFGIDSTGKRKIGIYILGKGKPEEVAFHDFDDLLKRAVEFNCDVETWLD